MLCAFVCKSMCVCVCEKFVCLFVCFSILGHNLAFSVYGNLLSLLPLLVMVILVGCFEQRPPPLSPAAHPHRLARSDLRPSASDGVGPVSQDTSSPTTCVLPPTQGHYHQMLARQACATVRTPSTVRGFPRPQWVEGVRWGRRGGWAPVRGNFGVALESTWAHLGISLASLQQACALNFASIEGKLATRVVGIVGNLRIVPEWPSLATQVS